MGKKSNNSIIIGVVLFIVLLPIIGIGIYLALDDNGSGNASGNASGNGYDVGSCIDPDPVTVGYNIDSVRGSKALDSFNLTGITCSDGYTGSGVAALCSASGTGYILSGCSSPPDSQTQGSPHNSCNSTYNLIDGSQFANYNIQSLIELNNNINCSLDSNVVSCSGVLNSSGSIHCSGTEPMSTGSIICNPSGVYELSGCPVPDTHSQTPGSPHNSCNSTYKLIGGSQFANYNIQSLIKLNNNINCSLDSNVVSCSGVLNSSGSIHCSGTEPMSTGSIICNPSGVYELSGCHVPDPCINCGSNSDCIGGNCICNDGHVDVNCDQPSCMTISYKVLPNYIGTAKRWGGVNASSIIPKKDMTMVEWDPCLCLTTTDNGSTTTWNASCSLSGTTINSSGEACNSHYYYPNGSGTTGVFRASICSYVESGSGTCTSYLHNNNNNKCE